MTGRRSPAPSVLAAFGLAGAELVALRGGGGTSWRARGVRDLVLKPVDGPSAEEDIAWWVGALPAVRDRAAAIRLVTPVATDDGRWTAEGWRADEWLAGAPQPARWRQVLQVAGALHAALLPLCPPPALAARSDRWAKADRAAWDEIHLEVGPPAQALDGRLRRLTRPAAGGDQLVHLDLLRNVLLADGLPPAVIDLSLYRRPALHGSAVVVADALLDGRADPAHLRGAGDAGTPATVARAVRFRLLDAAQQLQERGGSGAEAALAPYERVTALLERIAGDGA